MSRTRKFTNPIAVAMKSRYGKTTSVMKDRRAPRGGDRNMHREMLDEYELYTSSSFYDDENEDQNG